MDSIYKQFTGEAVFQAELEIVREAVRAFAGNWLADWKLIETADGFEATGQSAGLPAIAKFRIESAAGGTKVAVGLQVEQASPPGSTPAGTGKDYDNQIRKWLEAIPWWVQQEQAAANHPAGHHGNGFPSELPKRRRPRIGEIAGGSVIIFSLLAVTLYAISAVIGLLTGSLFLPSKRNPNPPPIHGLPARIISALILALFGWLVFTIWKLTKRKRNP
jgi:hypothetical protein